MSILLEHESFVSKARNAGFTNRETEVIIMVTMGFSNAEVANQLFITERLVKGHLEAIYKRAGCKDRVQLIVMCLPFLSDKYADVIASNK